MHITFNTNNDLAHHQEDVHTIKCPICNTQYDDKEQFTKHISKNHSKISCQICERDFCSKEELQKHRNEEHTITCHLCSSKFRTVTDMKEHAQSCIALTCNECNFTCFTDESLKEHVDEKHSQDISNASKDSSDRSHVEIITKFECSHCRQVFDSKEELGKHSENHARENCQQRYDSNCEVYSCQDCEYEAEEFPNMVTHVVLSHTKFTSNNQVVCPDCQTGFFTRKDLLYHCKEVHLGYVDVTDSENEIHDRYNHLKSNFERLKLLCQEKSDDLENVKSVYKEKLDEASEKYAQLVAENESLKEQVDVLFKLGRGYIEEKEGLKESPATSSEPELVVLETESTGNDENKRPNLDSFWNRQNFRGFKKTSHQKRVGFHRDTTDSSQECPSGHRDIDTINRNLQRIAAEPSPNSDMPLQHRLNRGVQYCHYYTNFGICQYEERTGNQCRFVHKIAPVCQNAFTCNRRMCMYTHPNYGGQGQHFLGHQGQNKMTHRTPQQTFPNQWSSPANQFQQRINHPINQGQQQGWQERR